MLDLKTPHYDIAELLTESRRAVVCRGRRRSDSHPVILKILKPESASPGESARLRREYEVLSSLDVSGCVQAYGLETYAGGAMLVLEDIGGSSLDRLPGGRSLPLPQFLDLAIALATSLAGLHQKRITHRNIAPAHVVLNPATGQVRLIGFGEADAAPERTLSPQPPAAPEENLAYCSPERTGRMNRPVDYRSDFYSLGITFYELLTGKLPFAAQDDLGLIHCHIAGVPAAPHEVAPAVPPALSRIVLKLMAKMAGDRYQSAWGLRDDLERCRRELSEQGRVSEFEPGLSDSSDRLRLPEKLVETGNLAAESDMHVNTLALCYLFGRYEEALAASELAEKSSAGMVAMAIEPVWYFYDSLTRLALCPADHPAQRSRLLERVAANQTYLGMRAHHAPMNFQNKLHLVEAERARVLGHGMEAMEHYDRSIQLAQQNAFIQEEALANELAGRFWLEKGKPEFAQVHLRKAREGFARWQTWAKVEALEAEFPELGHEGRAHADRAGGSLDVGTVIKAAHAFASEMELERLLGQVMRNVIENAGAQRGLLLLEQQGQWVVGASGATDGSDVEVPRPPRVQRDEVALGAVRFVARTRERLVLDDAANAGEFADDPHVRKQRTKSLLCSPLLRQGQLTGILYMENNLTTHAFTQERIELLEVLLSLAATLLENARIYQVLRESESRYRRIVDTAYEGIWVLGADGRTTFVNARMADMLGYGADQVSGRNMDDFMFEEDVADHLRQMEKCRRGMAEHYERRLRRKDGTTLWAVVSATPILDDEHRFQGSFGMLTDITERKQAEQRVSLLSFALDNVRECAFLIDEHARFQFANEEACRILGYSREDLLRMTVPDVDPDFPEGRWLEHWRDLRAKRSVLFEGRHRTRDGLMVPVEINANYFEYDRQGYNLALVRDITERKQAEAAILQLNRDLERRVAQRTVALERANKELETFSYSVSHDLRGPLRHIAGFASILQEDYRGALDARGRRYLHLVNQGAASMGRLLDDILAFMRVSRSEVGAGTVNMTALARAAFAELQARVEGRRIRFVLRDLPNARGDRAMLRRVWSNLLDNAIKYTAHKPEAVIEVFGSVQGAESLYCVKDNGAGFDMRYAGKLFGVFQRLHSAEEFEGTGIGLAMIQRIVTRHGGRVWAEGRVNEGAAFSFALPAELEAPPKACLSAAEWTRG